MRIRKKTKFILLFGLLLLVGCSSSTPSESDARAIFEKRYETQIKDGTVKVTKFKKINGQSGEFAGVKLYALEYEAEIEYPKGLHPECQNPAWTNFACGSLYSFKEVGKKEKFTDEMNFQKTENGWQIRK